MSQKYSLLKLQVMVDLETLSTMPNAAILSIGAATVQNPADGFYRKVKTFTSSAFDVSQATLDWWDQQEPAAREEAFSGTTDLEDALNDFKNWFPADAVIWSNGADFDLPILRHAFNYFSMEVPWDYRNVGCYRTLKNMFPQVPTPETRKELQHVAVWDAKWQAEHLKNMLQHWEGLQYGTQV